MAHSHTLTSLSETEAITDALNRAVIAFDAYDVGLLNSAFVTPEEDVVFEMNGNTTNGLKDLRTHLFDFVGPMDSTHMLSNIRVDLKEGATTASLTAYALAQHSPPGRGNESDGPKLLAGSEYFVDLVKNGGGEWKIKKWAMKVIWMQGDASVMKRPE